MTAPFIRAAAIRYAWAFLGLPYQWGGDDPIRGFDCSGFVIEALQGVGVLPHGFDTTADGLYRKFRGNETAAPGAGCLVFWFGADGKAKHVEMLVNDLHVIGASGGGSATTSREAAAEHNAFIKMRPLGYRGGNYKIVDPFMEKQ